MLDSFLSFLGALGQLGGGAATPAPAKPGKGTPAPSLNLTLVKELPAAQLLYPGMSSSLGLEPWMLEYGFFVSIGIKYSKGL